MLWWYCSYLTTGSWQGVAPDATLLSYKVFTQVDGTDEDTLIQAFLDAYKAEVCNLII